MIKKLVLVGGLALVLALGLIAGRGTPTKAFVGLGIQDFNLDLVNCLLPAYPDTVSPNPETGYPQVCLAGEDKSVGGSAGYSTAIGLIEGNRQGFPYVYSGPGWVLQDDPTVPDLTVVGDVASTIDIYADGNKDVLGAASNCGGPPNNCPVGSPLTLPTTTPEDYVKQTLTWTATSGCDGTDETFLTDILPGASAMTPYVRYRACLTTLFLSGIYRIDIKALNGVATPLNLVNLTLKWQPSTIVNLITLGGEAASPSTGLLTQDTPQASISHTDAPYATNPTVATGPGLYVRWMTEISNEDAADRAINFVYGTSCKAIGGNFTDGDADCLATVANGGGPADANDANPDQDNDGLLDGVEVAWGSNPLLSDTDADGRTDAEEMVGPTQFLTNPKVADTDLDGVDDGGLKLDLKSGLYDGPNGCQDDAGPDGAPDCPDWDGDGISTGDPGIGPNIDATSPADGSSHVRVGYRIVGWDIEPDGGGNDNCPGIPNGATPPEDNQANFDLDTASSWGHGDLYGDACDSDDENDNFNDVAELEFQWNAGAHQCSNDNDLPGPATPLTLNNPDSDGDGVLDGSECWGGANPIDPGDSPGAPATTAAPPRPADKDALNNAMETDRRTEGFSDQPSPPIGVEDVDLDGQLGKSDSDSDGDGLSDGCETFVTGTHPMRTDSDSNGTLDPLEPNLKDAGEPIALHCQSLEDMDLDGVTDDVDNCPFVNAAQTNTQPLIANGKGIAGDDKSVPWNPYRWSSPPAPAWDIDLRGDACDGDLDNDSVTDATDADGAAPPLDITYDDAVANGTVCQPLDPGGDLADDGASWDTDCDTRLQGVDAICSAVPIFPDMPAGWATADADKDGLLNKWEFCKWASSPLYGNTDSDGDGRGDCVEAADVQGDGALNFTGDVIYYAKAILLGKAAFGQDGQFDINADGALNFTGDVIQEAKFGLLTGLCK